MRRVFLDTVGLLAIWDEADQWHLIAESAMVELSRYPCEFFTSNGVLLECGNASAKKPYRREVVELRNTLLQSGRILSPTDDELEMAWRAYEKRSNSSAGIVDQVSFVLMRRLRIQEAFTNDEHFRVAGFSTLF